MNDSLSRLLAFRLTSQFRFNISYALNWVSELWNGKIALQNNGYYPSDLKDRNAYQLQLYLELMAAGQISRTKALSVCDLGCGQGHGTIFLLENYLHPDSTIVGLDIAWVAIAYCRVKYRRIKNAEFRSNTDNLPFPSRSLDVVVSVGSTCPHSSAYLQEIHRCLKDDGVFVFYETYHSTEEVKFDLRLAHHGFKTIQKTNITENVVQVIVHNNERRLAELSQSRLPDKLIAVLKKRDRLVAQSKLDAYQSNRVTGLIYVLHKVADFQPTEPLAGHIDLWDGHHLKGWAFSPKHDRPLTLQVMSQGAVIAETVAGLPRHDVAKAHGKNRLHSGFSVALPIPEAGGDYAVQVVDADTGQKLGFTDFVITHEGR